MQSPQLNFINLLHLKDGSLAKYEGTEGSGEGAKLKIRRLVLRFASPALGRVETVPFEDIDPD